MHSNAESTALTFWASPLVRRAYRGSYYDNYVRMNHHGVYTAADGSSGHPCKRMLPPRGLKHSNSDRVASSWSYADAGKVSCPVKSLGVVRRKEQ